MDLREVPGQLSVRHPWERARADFFARLISDQLAPQGPLRVLDVGAGDGFLARTLLARLPAGSEVVCFDSGYGAAHLAAPTTPGLSLTSVRPAGPFGLLLLLDVLEHVADDRAFLRQMVDECLAIDGAILVSVPAFMSLYTRHDVVLGHQRRYRPAQLRAMLGAAGLHPAIEGGLFHSLLVPRTIRKLAELLHGSRSAPVADPPPAHADTELGRWRASAAVTWTVEAMLAADNWLSRIAARSRLSLPGLSVWALARRSGA